MQCDVMSDEEAMQDDDGWWMVAVRVASFRRR